MSTRRRVPFVLFFSDFFHPFFKAGRRAVSLRQYAVSPRFSEREKKKNRETSVSTPRRRAFMFPKRKRRVFLRRGTTGKTKNRKPFLGAKKGARTGVTGVNEWGKRGSYPQKSRKLSTFQQRFSTFCNICYRAKLLKRRRSARKGAKSKRRFARR